MSQPLPGEGFFFGGTCERGPSVFSHWTTVQYWPMPHSVVPRLKYVDCDCYQLLWSVIVIRYCDQLLLSGIVIMVNVITLYNCAVLTDATFGCARPEICRLWLLSVIVISYCYQVLWSWLMLSHCTTVQYWPMPHSVVPRLKTYHVISYCYHNI